MLKKIIITLVVAVPLGLFLLHCYAENQAAQAVHDNRCEDVIGRLDMARLPPVEQPETVRALKEQARIFGCKVEP